MPTYTFFIYSVSVLSFNGGTNAFDFAAGYDSTQDRFRIDVNDDDAVMNSGGDANQNADIFDLNGTLVDSGNIFVPAFAEIDDGAGGSIFLDRVEIDGDHYGYVSTTPLTPGTSYPVINSGTFEENHTYYQANSTPCFGPNTQIETSLGPRTITSLKRGDQVMTYDNGPQPVLWVGHVTVPLIQALASPSTRPVTFNGGLQGMNDPSLPLILSQQHRVMAEGPSVSLLTGNEQVFVPAGVLNRPTIPRHAFTWHHILLPQHEVICANGVWVESLFASDALTDLLDTTHCTDITRATQNAPHLQTTRKCLRWFEAQVLIHHMRRNSSPIQTRNNRVA